MHTDSTRAAELDTFDRWVSDHGRLPRMSSLNPTELSLARWLEGKRPEALAGTLDAETTQALRSIPGAVPARSSRSIGEWCTLVEGFMLDRGALPSAASPDAFEASLARAVDDVVIPVVRTGGSLLDYSALDASLPELLKHAVRLREAPFARQPNLPKPAPTVRPRKPNLPKPAPTVRPRKPNLPNPAAAAAAAAAAGARAREQENRLDEMRAYVAANGFRPPVDCSLGRWAAQQIAVEGRAVSGVADELSSIRSAYPGYSQAKHLRWALKAADHIRVHGTLPRTAESTVQARQLELLRQAEETPGLPPGPLAVIRTVLAAPPAPGLAERAQQLDARRLKDLRDYVQEHGHLPARNTLLGGWFGHRIVDDSRPGTVEELNRLKGAYPSCGGAKDIAWAQAAAARHAEHGSVSRIDQREFARKQDSLRKLIDQYDLPGHLLPAIEVILAQPDFSRQHAYTTKWSAVFSDFTAWVDAHGSLPNRRSADREEYRLANWLNVQRVNQRVNTLRPDLAERLGSVQGALTPRVTIRPTRDDRIAQVVNFHAATGRFPSRGSRDDTERSLGTWLYKMRCDIREGRAAAADFGELANLKGALKPRPKGPTPRTNTESATRVADFHALHGRLPRRNLDDTEELRLSRWLENTRMAVRSGKVSASDLGGLASIPGALGTRPPS